MVMVLQSYFFYNLSTTGYTINIFKTEFFSCCCIRPGFGVALFQSIAGIFIFCIYCSLCTNSNIWRLLFKQLPF
ncbi:MAG: hypothetical protein D3904_10500 [Candidatus Electrothrix sp. EH2]|nr:hypothetical protein [Candidatus Electrothrix sp. EH2]